MVIIASGTSRSVSGSYRGVLWKIYSKSTACSTAVIPVSSLDQVSYSKCRLGGRGLIGLCHAAGA